MFEEWGDANVELWTETEIVQIKIHQLLAYALNSNDGRLTRADTGDTYMTSSLGGEGV